MDAVTGITGQVGGAVARSLLAAGRHVRAVVRDAAKGKPWAERGCEVAIADMADVEALTRAFSGTEAVFVLIPPVFDPSPGFPETKRVVAAVKSALDRARPAKVVCLSTIGAQATRPNLLSQLSFAEQELGTLPLPVTFLRAAWFMENTAWDIAPARQTGIIQSFLQPLDRPVPMVAVADIGRIAAEFLHDAWSPESQHHPRIVELEGRRRVAPNDIAASLAAILGRPVRAQIVARDDWEGLFVAQGMKNPMPRMQMLDGFNQGWIEFEGGTTNSRKGEISLDQALNDLVARG